MMRIVGTAAAVGLAAGIFGGVIGFFVARLLVEWLGVVEGPPAGVLLVLLPCSLTVACAFVGFVLAFWRLWKAAARKSAPAR